MSVPTVQPWRPDLETYHRLAEIGAFEDARVELLDGLITEMTPKGREHEQALSHLTRLAFESVGRRYEIRVQFALSLGAAWEPEPDLALVAPDTPRPYHPGGAALVAEVAASSLRRDLTVKMPLYGRSAIPECWVVDVGDLRLHRFRRPCSTGYEREQTLTTGTIEAEAVEGLTLDLPALWRAVRG